MNFSKISLTNESNDSFIKNCKKYFFTIVDDKSSQTYKDAFKIAEKMSIEDIVTKLYLEFPYFGYALSNLDRKFSVDTRTIHTSINEKCIYINPIYWIICTEKEKIAMLQHEVLHISFQHYLRFFYYLKDKDHKIRQIASISMDIAIGQLIDVNPLFMPTYAQIKKNITGLKPRQSAEYYFSQLTEDVQSSYDKISQDLNINNMIASSDESHSNTINKSMAENELNEYSLSLINCILDMAKSKQEEHEKKNIDSKLFSEILPKNVISHRSMFKNLINQCIGNELSEECEYVYNRINRRNDNSLWGKKHKIKDSKIDVVIDTSASISNDMLSYFIGYTSHAMKKYAVVADIVYCDEEIREIQENVRKINVNEKLNVFGRTNTNLVKALDYINGIGNKKKKVLIFTDGYTPWKTYEALDTYVVYTNLHNELEGVKKSVILDQI